MEIKGVSISRQPEVSRAQNEALREAAAGRESARAAERSGGEEGDGVKGVEPLKSRKAFFALDENENVVIRVIDDKGRLVRQIPPEEYLKMSQTLKECVKNLLDIEV